MYYTTEKNIIVVITVYTKTSHQMNGRKFTKVNRATTQNGKERIDNDKQFDI